jgi:predicted nucleic acid-binding protein
MIDVVPDSSFYICFLDDIEAPQILERLLICPEYNYFTGDVISEEIEKSKNFPSLEKIFHKMVTRFDYFDYGEIMRPLFSREQINKGENEVIVIIYILNKLNREYVGIIDEITARNFVSKNFPDMFENITGTLGFLRISTTDRKIISKEECISVLMRIRASKFRVDVKLIDKVQGEITGCK